MTELTGQKFTNPYTPFRPAISNFVGRRDIWRDDFRLRALRLGAKDEHYIFFGPGGIGKTSLLIRLERFALAKLNLPAIYIDLGAPEIDLRDAVTAMRSVLPLRTADQLLAPLRSKFGLPAEAGRDQIVTEVARRVGRAISVSFPLGIHFYPHDFVIESDIKESLKAFRSQLGETIRRGDTRAVILLDQVGLIAGQWGKESDAAAKYFLQALGETLIQARGSSVLFALGLRGERLGTLVGVVPELMNPRVNKAWPLKPLSREEAAELVRVPAATHPWRIEYASSVVDELLLVSGYEPYNLQLCCFYLWQSLTDSGELTPGSAISISRDRLVELITGRLEDRFWEWLTVEERQVLKIIAQYQPVTRVQLTTLAKGEGIGTPEKSLSRLEHSDWRPIRYIAETGEFLITHDLLREYIEKEHIAPEEQDVALLRKTVWDAPRMFRAFGRVLSGGELEKLWLLRKHLDLDSAALEIIALSELQREEDRIAYWGAEYPGDITASLLSATTSVTSVDDRIRVVKALGKVKCPDAIDGLRRRFLVDEAFEVRVAAVAALGGAKAVGPLMGALNDEDSRVRSAAARALGQIGDAKAVELLIEALRDGATDVRREATWALGQIGEPAVGLLTEALQDQHRKVRQRVVEALGQISDPGAVEPLMVMLQDEDRVTRRKAVRALGQIDSAHAIEVLTQALRHVNSDVRRQAAGTLGQIGDTRAVGPLIEALLDEDTVTRRKAVQALGQIGDSQAVEPLIVMLQDEDIGTRRRAVKALGQIGDAQAVGSLIAALQDEDSKVRGVTAQALVQIGEPAVEPLIVALSDEDVKVCRAAAWILGKIGDERAVELLIGAVREAHSPEPFGRRAAEALGRIADARAVEPLIEALRNGVTDVRREAAWALGQIGDPQAVEPLIEALRDGDGKVRWEASRALGQIGELALESLTTMLREGDSRVRGAAARALGQIGDRRAVEVLMEAARDEDWRTRRRAVEALGQIGDARAVESIVAALNDVRGSVRQRAAESLAQIGDPQAVEPLIRALDDKAYRVCRAAAEALGRIGDPRAIPHLERVAMGTNRKGVAHAAAQAMKQIRAVRRRVQGGSD